MNSTLVIARRELAEKRFVLAAACAFSVLALLIPFFPGIHAPYSEVVTLTSGWLALGFTLGLAHILGASMVGRELSENRLSFYFARPVSAAAIWFGKLLAAAVLVTASFLIIGAPALLTGIDAVIRSWIPNTYAFIGAVAFAAAVLFFAAHIIGTIVRSRSAWIALDFACLVATTLAVCAVLVLPIRAEAGMITAVASIILALGAVIVAITAGAWQLSHGRTDRRSNHLALSRFLWSGVAAVLVAAAAYVSWALAASPADLIEISGRQANHGWVLIEGLARHRGNYRPAFLINTGNGHALRIGSPPWWGYDSSRDGSTVAWMQPASIDGRLFELVSCRLNAIDPRPEPTGIITPAHGLSLSDDGRRALIGWNRSSLTVYDLATHHSLGSFRIEMTPDAYMHAYFASPNSARVHLIFRDKPGAPAFSRAYEYNITTRTLRYTGTAPGRIRSVSPDHQRMIVQDVSGLSLVDAATGRGITAISSGDRVGNARFLADGSLAVTTTDRGTVVVRHLSRDGAPLGQVPVGKYDDGYVAGGDGHRAVVELRSARFESVALAVVNLDRGIIERVDPTLRRAIIDRSGSFDDEVLGQTTTGIVAWTLTTGAKRVIAGH